MLIGEASHGTHDFYRERALITQRLIEENGFNAVAIEGDWPDAARVHRFVHGGSKDVSARMLSDTSRSAHRSTVLQPMLEHPNQAELRPSREGRN